MRRKNLSALLLLAAAASVPAAGAPALELRSGDRICLIGNTFAERFQLFGYFESQLLAAFPDLDLSVRNLAWSGDEAALRLRPDEFGMVDQHLHAQDADVVLMFYGANESFAGDDGLPAFRDDLGSLLRDILRRRFNGSEPPRIALVSPIPYETPPAGSDLDAAAVSPRNAQLRAYSEAAASVAAEHGVAFLDIFDRVAATFAVAPSPLTINGLHLNGTGYRQMAQVLIEAIGGRTPGTVDIAAAGAVEVEFTPPVLVWGAASEPAPLRITVSDLHSGYYVLRRGDETLAAAYAATWAAGVDLHATATGPLAESGDALRGAVLRKSRLFFDRYRAVNGVYIYGERKDRFGVVSFPPEMARFDELVAQLDGEVSELARSNEVWRLVVDDPDPENSAITGFTFVHAAGPAPDPDAFAIVAGGQLDLVALGMAPNVFTVRADAGRDIGSVELTLEGPLSASRTENGTPPYALHGDDGSGDYEGIRWPVGEYRVTATAYSGSDLTGGAMGRMTASFAVVESYDLSVSPVTGLSLVAANTVSLGEIATLGNGATLMLAPDEQPATIQARTEMALGALRLELNGPVSASRTDAEAPFTLHADGEGVAIAPGDYQATATAYFDTAQEYAFAPYLTSFAVRRWAREVDRDFPALAAAGNDDPYGMWSDGATLWVTDFADGQVYAYDLSTGARQEERDLETAPSGNSSPLGLWSDGETVWVSDAWDATLYAYWLADGQRRSRRDIDLGGKTASDLWSDGETLWVTVYPSDSDRRLVAYGFDGSRKPDRDVALAAENSSPRGLWSDGERVLVADSGGPAWVHVYRDGAWSPSEALRLPSANLVPQAVWSDGRTLWTTDLFTRTIHSYALEPPSSNPSLTLLRLSGVDIGEFSPSSTEYGGEASAAQVTVTAYPASGADVEIDPADADPAVPGHQVALSEGANVVAIAVTAADGESTRTYTVTVARSVWPLTPPAVSGVIQVGMTLEASFNEAPPAELAYQWLREGAKIAGATDSSYVPAAIDTGAMLSVRVSLGDWTAESASMGPVWAAPGNPPVAAHEEELLGTVVTVGSTDAYPLLLGGYGRLPRANFGALDQTVLGIDGVDKEVTVAAVNAVGGFLLKTHPDLTDLHDVWAYWNGYRIGPLQQDSSKEGLLWVAQTPQPPAEVGRHTDGSSDGVRVALSIRRALPRPTVTITSPAGAVTEGSSAVFKVRLDGPARTAMPVAVDVVAQGSVLSGEPPSSVTIEAGSTVAQVSVNTDDDSVVEDGGSVTVTLRPGEDYLLGEALSATVGVEDDDEASFLVTAEPLEILEGGEATIRVAIEDGVTFAVAQTLELKVTGDVSATEYTLDPEALNLAAGASSATAVFAALPDEVEEELETARIAASLEDVDVGAAEVRIRLPSDATLSDLVLSNVDIGDFDSDRTSYEGAVSADIELTTVEATPSDANSEVEIADATGSTVGVERTSRLAVGANAVSVTVTGDDGVTARTYTVTVTRSPGWGSRLPDRDIELGGSGESTGVWSDGETLWALRDWDASTLRAYDLATGERERSRDKSVHNGWTYASLWSDGETLWGASLWWSAVHAYRLSDGARLADAGLAEALSDAGSDAPTGLWSDGGVLFIVDNSDARVYAYAADGTRAQEREFDLRTGDISSGWPWALWSDGEIVLTSWLQRGWLRAYRLSDGERLPSYDIDVGGSGNGNPRDLWSDGKTLWVVDAADRKLYAYAVPDLRPVASAVSALRVESRAVRVPREAPGPPVALPDARLRRRLEAALGKAHGEVIGEQELAALESLDARDAGVRDLTGLEYAANLTALDLGGNTGLDLHVLMRLPKLEALNVDGAVSDLWSLSGMSSLTRLSVRDNGLRDITALGLLPRLTELDVGGNRLADLGPFVGLASLKTLRADGNVIRDVTPLAGLPSLETVDLRNNRIVDVGRFEDLSGFVEVDLGGNPGEAPRAPAQELER